MYVKKTKYVLLFRHRNASQNRDIKISIRSFKNVSELRYLGMKVTNQTFIKEEIKRRLNPGNTCYHSVQNLLSSSLLFKTLIVIIYKTVMLLWFCMGAKIGVRY
jgi:hypothetical protein